MSDTINQSFIKHNHTPILVGEKITLRAFKEEDITSEYIGWLNDERITCYSEQRHRKHTIENCHEYFKGMQNNGNLFWAILALDSDKKHIGNLSAYLDKNNQVADLAIMIGDHAAQGKGFGRDAWSLASDYLLEAKIVRKITAGTMAINAAMLNIMKSTGMQQEGCKKKQFLLNGKEIDLILMARFAKN